MLVVARKNRREPDERLWRVKKGGGGSQPKGWTCSAEYADLLGTMQIRWVNCQVRESWRREE